MSNLNSAKDNTIGSANVSIAKARQNIESARQAMPQARQNIESARQAMLSSVSPLNAASDEIGSSTASGAAPVPTPSGCRLSRDCAEGWACIDGTCIDMSGPGSDRISTPGDCELPDDGLAENPCGKPGGCDKPTCGEDLDKGGIDCCGGTIYRGYVTERIGTNPDSLEPITRQVYKEQCEPLDYECDQYADFWYKATGDLLSGYETTQICNSCNECAEGKICRPISEAFAPCYCWPGICKDKEGPCFECDSDSGDCLETCTGCAAECNQFFTCPCDPAQDRYEALGSFNPCTSASGGCWQATAEKITSFCEETFPCQDKNNQCKGDCETLKSTSGYPDCPAGKICQQNGFIQNAETGATTYFVTSCDTKSDCGCAAPPNSPLYKACGECEICENGSCVSDPLCGERFESDRGRNYEVYSMQQEKALWQCITCWNGEPYDEPGTHCGNQPGGQTSISFFGGCCDPEDPDCVQFHYPCNGSFEGEAYSDRDYFYSDGNFSISGAGSGVVSHPCRDCVPGQRGESEITFNPIGSYSYERRVNLWDETGAIVKRLLVQFSPKLVIRSGVSRSNCMVNPNDVTISYKLIGVKPANFITKPPLRFPLSQWPPQALGYVSEIDLDA